jgi:hypothetical protein
MGIYSTPWLYALIIAWPRTGSSVKQGQILHLTASGVVDRVVGIEKEKSFSSGRSASKFIPMVVKLVGQ